MKKSKKLIFVGLAIAFIGLCLICSLTAKARPVSSTATPSRVAELDTPISTSVMPTYTPTSPPPSPEHPAGTSGKCKDGTYTDAKHKQGACSSHGGVVEWWGPK